MSDPNNHFIALQAAILARLVAVDATVPAPASAGAAVPYLTEVKGDIVNLLTQSLNKLGIGVVIRTPLAKMLRPGSPALEMDAPVMIEVQENVTINQGANGSKIPALTLVSFIMKRLHWFPHNIYEGSKERQRIKLDAVPFILIPDQSFLTYAVAAHARLNLSAPLRA